MPRTATTLDVCIDCLHLLANGECPDGTDTEEHVAKVNAIWGNTEITLGSLDQREDERESWFSWSACDGCGSHLGGDREHATAWS